LVKRRFPGQVDVVNEGIEKEGAFYLFGLRMIPVMLILALTLLGSFPFLAKAIVAYTRRFSGNRQ
jgi:hypothetical protein